MSGIVNQLGAVSGVVGTTSGAGGFESGTKMCFNQTASPAGWTKATSSNDVALRLATGTVGTGGTVAFETALASHTSIATSGAVSAHTLSLSQSPSHNHQVPYASGSISPGEWTLRLNNWTYTGIGASGGGGSHTHSFTQPNIGAVDMNVSYVDVILAEKD